MKNQHSIKETETCALVAEIGEQSSAEGYIFLMHLSQFKTSLSDTKTDFLKKIKGMDQSAHGFISYL